MEKERKVRLDDKYVLCSDQHCWWVERNEAAKGKKPLMRRCSGYCTTFAEAINSCLEFRLRDAEAADLAELRHEIWKVKRDVRSWKCKV